MKIASALWSKIGKNTDKSFTVPRVSGASERANGGASGPVLQSVFLAVFDHSASDENVSLSLFLATEQSYEL